MQKKNKNFSFSKGGCGAVGMSTEREKKIVRELMSAILTIFFSVLWCFDEEWGSWYEVPPHSIQTARNEKKSFGEISFFFSFSPLSLLYVDEPIDVAVDLNYDRKKWTWKKNYVDDVLDQSCAYKTFFFIILAPQHSRGYFFS
jgi:hypothetical protein